ncbi:type III secretion system protein SctP (plasmid) [Ralstonia sp. 25C]|uniref:type III secretion system protein SctP n=1 Tax=Ralstonia sp. 25C TaxID=3447363 RepID=UPI003F74F36A
MTTSVRLWRAPPITPAPHPATPARRAATSRNAEARASTPTGPSPAEHALWLPPDGDDSDTREAMPERESSSSDDGADAQPEDATPDTPTAQHTSAMANRLVRACSEISVGNTVTEHLAQLLSRFCGSHVVKAGGECWEVTLDLDPRVLPETRLTLQLSPHTLWLRFHAGHPRARDLLSEHGDALRQRVHVLLEQRIDVELEVW